MLASFIVKSEHKKRRLRLLALIFLIFFSNTFVFDRFMNAWEVPAVTDNRIPPVEAAIVLTGMATMDVKNNRLEFNDRTDRLMQVIRLYSENKIKKIVLCGGPGTVVPSDTLNAGALRNFLITCGIDRHDIIMEEASNNTHENAVFVKPILDYYFPDQKFLLVSSGWHLRRATACFRNEGINVIAYSTDRYSGPVKFEPGYLFLPSASTLFNWEKLTHEWVGCIVYWLRGYI